MRTIILLALFLSANYAQSIESLIQSSFKHNYTLKAMQKELEINNQSIKSSDNWDNPILSGGITDLQIDDISDRTLEPMQTQFVTISQKIPLANKKGISRNISKLLTKVSQLKIKDKKAQIASNITAMSYKSVIIDGYLKLIEKRVKNLEKMKKLTLAYQQDAHKSLEIDLKILKQENKMQTLLFQKEELIQKIQKLTVVSVTDIHADIKLKNLPLTNLQTHPKIALLQQQLKIQNKNILLSLAKKTPDIKVSGGYFQRDNRSDYFNLSLALPLTIGNSEEVEVVKSKLKASQTKQRLNDLKNSFKNEVALLQKKAINAKKNYKRYRDKLLPKQKKITAYLRKKNHIIKTIKSLNDTLYLEESALKELDTYFNSFSKLIYFK